MLRKLLTLTLLFLLVSCGNVTSQDRTVIIHWTAVADDGSDVESGPAAWYEVKTHTDSLTDVNWVDGDLWTGDIPVPSEPGTKDSITITMPSDTTVWVAIRVWDDAVMPNGPNVSGVSNSVKIEWDETPPTTVVIYVRYE